MKKARSQNADADVTTPAALAAQTAQAAPGDVQQLRAEATVPRGEVVRRRLVVGARVAVLAGLAIGAAGAAPESTSHLTFGI